MIVQQSRSKYHQVQCRCQSRKEEGTETLPQELEGLHITEEMLGQADKVDWVVPGHDLTAATGKDPRRADLGDTMAADHANTSLLMLENIGDWRGTTGELQPWRRNAQKWTRRIGRGGSYRNRLQHPASGQHTALRRYASVVSAEVVIRVSGMQR